MPMRVGKSRKADKGVPKVAHGDVIQRGEESKMKASRTPGREGEEIGACKKGRGIRIDVNV